MRYPSVIIFLFLSFFGRAQVYVLGIAQDGGYPHAGCTKKCCTMAWENPGMRRFITSLALTDSASHKWWLFEATPDITAQLQYFRELTGGRYNYLPDGIFITHAHIGHYTGLMQLGREVMNTKDIPVYVLPKMKKYLQENGPWSQLVQLHNIKLIDIDERIDDAKSLKGGIMRYNLSPQCGVFAFTVPHRDEFSETAGFGIFTPGRSYGFIPDIDKWNKWDIGLYNLAAFADVLLIDGTFYQDGEIPGRSMAEIPHPFVTETMSLLVPGKDIAGGHSLARKVYFIHFNHTNPLLWDAVRQQDVRARGFNLANQGQKL